jgi:hypothetical protein
MEKCPPTCGRICHSAVDRQKFTGTASRVERGPDEEHGTGIQQLTFLGWIAQAGAIDEIGQLFGEPSGAYVCTVPARDTDFMPYRQFLGWRYVMIMNVLQGLREGQIHLAIVRIVLLNQDMVGE